MHKIYNAPSRPDFEPDVNRPKLTMNNNNGIFYLNNSYSVPAEDCPEQKIPTNKLKVDFVYGGEAVYEFIT